MVAWEAPAWAKPSAAERSPFRALPGAPLTILFLARSRASPKSSPWAHRSGEDRGELWMDKRRCRLCRARIRVVRGRSSFRNTADGRSLAGRHSAPLPPWARHKSQRSFALGGQAFCQTPSSSFAPVMLVMGVMGVANLYRPRQRPRAPGNQVIDPHYTHYTHQTPSFGLLYPLQTFFLILIGVSRFRQPSVHISPARRFVWFGCCHGGRDFEHAC